MISKSLALGRSSSLIVGSATVVSAVVGAVVVVTAAGVGVGVAVTVG